MGVQQGLSGAQGQQWPQGETTDQGRAAQDLPTQTPKTVKSCSWGKQSVQRSWRT